MEYKDLEKFGLNKNEAKVYLNLVKLGSATASEIVKQIGFHRNIVYDNLEKLIDKGLVSYIIQGTKKKFNAQNPETILDFLDKKKEEIESKIKFAQSIIPDLTKIRNTKSESQNAEIFRGINGMKKVLLKTLDAKEIFVFGMTNKSTEILGETYWKNYNAKIKYKKIKEKFLINFNFEEIYSFKENKRIKLKRLPEELNQITETIFFEGNVAIFIYSENPIVFLIQDGDLFNSYMKHFEFLWRLSK